MLSQFPSWRVNYVNSKKWELILSYFGIILQGSIVLNMLISWCNDVEKKNMFAHTRDTWKATWTLHSTHTYLHMENHHGITLDTHTHFYKIVHGFDKCL